VLNAEFSSATRAALGGELSPRLRACIPFAKLLEVALSELPSAFIFRGRAWRAVRHVFPGYPGFKNLHGGPSPQVHDPEGHFADGSTVCWRVVSLPVHHSRTTPARKFALRRYQFSSCSKHRQGVLDFAGWSGRRAWLRHQPPLLLRRTRVGGAPPAHAAAGDRSAEQDVRA